MSNRETEENPPASVGSEPTREQLKALRELVESGFIPTLEEMVKQLTAPFFWYDPEEVSGSRTIGGGTVCFVDTGVRLLGLTAAHVHQACIEALERDPELGCQIGGHSFQPSEHLIDIDWNLDLATYRISEIQASAAGSHFHSPPVWPPEAPSDNDLVLVGGWPWRSVIERTDSSRHDFVHCIGRSAGASQRYLSMAMHRSTSIPYGGRSLSPDLNLGGMSGGAMCVLRHLLGPEMIARTELVGVISQLGPEPIDLMLARPLTRIAADGQLIRDDS